MATYRTPNVYVEEISVFPPSIAEVETAIPAFVGYTARATKVVNDDLRNVPTRVKSLLEFELYFGGGPKPAVSEVNLDDANNFVSAKVESNEYLYDSLRLFFDNGGGDCYIVSVGAHGSGIAKDDMIGGLDKLRKVDEPTILLFPDAAGLSSDDLAAVQQQALMQCGELKDRVTVLDTRSDDVLGEAFRDKIGINNLKYGAAYSPWLKLRYSKNIGYADVKGVLKKSGAPIELSALTGQSDVLGLIKSLDAVLADQAGLDARLAPLTGGKGVTARYGELLIAYQNQKTPANVAALFGYLYDLASVVDAMVVGGAALKADDLKRDVNNTLKSSLVPAFTTLIALERELKSEINAYTTQFDQASPASPDWAALFAVATAPAASNTEVSAAADDAGRMNAAVKALGAVFTPVTSAVDGIRSAAGNYAKSYEQTLVEAFGVLRNVLRGVNDTLTLSPPSGAVAGVYALVDGQRGVWKAPANVSLNSVIEPSYYFDGSETDLLNIDVNAGKSINAIRAFSGKGTLVWGARTLAGNDNEWRYVSVRRFFTMVEESVKKSTYWAVFEPNDANTWVKVRGMVENYLNQKWREGALAGATPKDAFFVRCGLGVTMNAQDILEGRMNVEIGMAVVRPAEFIVLKFSHLLQKS